MPSRKPSKLSLAALERFSEKLDVPFAKNLFLAGYTSEEGKTSIKSLSLELPDEPTAEQISIFFKGYHAAFADKYGKREE